MLSYRCISRLSSTYRQSLCTFGQGQSGYNSRTLAPVLGGLAGTTRYGGTDNMIIRQYHDNQPSKPIGLRCSPALLNSSWNLIKFQWRAMKNRKFEIFMFKTLSQWFDGFLQAFTMVTPLIGQDLWEDLEGIVSDEVIENLKASKGLYLPKNHIYPYGEKIFKKPALVRLMDVRFEGPLFTTESRRNLEVDVNYLFFPKVLEDEYLRTKEFGQFHMANFRFFRPYVDGVPADDWLITDITYFSQEDVLRERKERKNQKE